MKVAFTTSGKDLEATLDSRFGRCTNFLLLDTETNQFEIVDNAENKNAAQGAGIQSAQTIVESGATALVTGRCGPKALQVLEKAGILIYAAEEKPLKDLALALSKGELPKLQDSGAV